MDTELTRLLHAWGGGDDDAFVALMPYLQDELRGMAARFLAGERKAHTLQPTALVNEVYVRLLEKPARFDDRAHFFGSMARAMRRILVDHARKTNAAKRGGNAKRVSLTELTPPAEDDLDVVALDDALARLAEVDPRRAHVVELRYFAGLGVEETAAVLGVGSATVKRDWSVARAWLFRELA